MKLVTKCLMTVALATSISSVFAGNEGGGGNAIVCFNNPEIPVRLRLEKAQGNGAIADQDISSITSVEILDLYEAKFRKGNALTIGKPLSVIEANKGESASDYVKRIDNRYKNVFPGIHINIEKGKSALQDWIEFPHGLTTIDDIGPGANYDTQFCVRSTIIGQYNKGGLEYIGYDPRIFSLPSSIHSDTSKSIAILHEYLYNSAIKGRANTSDGVRMLIGQLINKNASYQDVKKHLTILSVGENYASFSVAYTVAHDAFKKVINDHHVYDLGFKEMVSSFKIDRAKEKCEEVNTNLDLLKKDIPHLLSEVVDEINSKNEYIYVGRGENGTDLRVQISQQLRNALIKRVQPLSSHRVEEFLFPEKYNFKYDNLSWSDHYVPFKGEATCFPPYQDPSLWNETISLLGFDDLSKDFDFGFDD